MTSNLTVCYMATRANQPHVERAAVLASLVEEAIANGRRESASTHRPAAPLARPGMINRLLMSIAGMRGAAMTQTEGLGTGD